MRDTTIVWRPKYYPADKFDYNKVAERVERIKESGDKDKLAIITHNIKKAVEDNPHLSEFLNLVK
jgi:hypothetical protein